MVLQIPAANPVFSIRYLKSVLEYTFRLRKISIKQYVSAETAAEHLGVSVAAYMVKVCISKRVHGIRYKGKIYLHPDGHLKEVKRIYKEGIKRFLEEPTSEGTYEDLDHESAGAGLKFPD
jgi:hypothetical protein